MTIIKISCHSVEINFQTPYNISKDITSVGTGFMIDDNTFLTCFHVVDGAIRLSVSWTGLEDTLLDAETIMSYPEADLALIRLKDPEKVKHLKKIKLGNSDLVKKLDKVVAIGYQLGEDMVASTKGVISRRSGHNIQTDTAINGGNSGGPLINEDGEAIGVISSKILFQDNVGYATPINQFKVIMKERGHVLKAKLHMKFQPNSKDILKYKGFDSSDTSVKGTLITNILPYSPFNSILNNGDILCKVDNYRIDFNAKCYVDWYDEKIPLNDIMYRYRSDQNITIEYIQDGEYKIRQVKLQRKLLSIRYLYYNLDTIEYCVFGGMVVIPFNLNVGILQESRSCTISKYLNDAVRDKPCLFVSKVLSGSQLKSNPIIKSGDILSEVNHHKVTTIDEYKKALQTPICLDDRDVLVWKTTENKTYVSDIKEILKEEKNLSITYKYTSLLD